MNKILLASGLVLCLIACTKEKPKETTSPYQYFNKDILTNFAGFKLYTKNGEVNNATLVQQYANEFSNFFYTAASSFTDKEFTKFAMVKEDSFINISMAPVAELKRTSVDVYDKFKSKYYEIANDTNNLILHISKYKMYETKTTTLGYTYFDVESPAYIFKKVNENLYFPIVRYVIISRGDNMFSFATGKFNNVFSPTGINKLGTSDTLLVQSFDLVMKKGAE